ncbi:hypothetical protein Pmani_010764 [Petrolisthes manimaculis]|uniref:Uncharacterized protein n=1 Tax=Petrolisthes manimaculis TaxID=1843537 RepID=A0AAE1UCD8_9EUCA|nr:hypothetical protein Pmani_010764 [Petrolisthes manimaculis]
MRKGGSPGRGPGRPVSWCIGANSGLALALHDPRDGQDSRSEVSGRALARSTSYQALHSALARLYRIDDFNMERIGAGFFSEVFKILAWCRKEKLTEERGQVLCIPPSSHG